MGELSKNFQCFLEQVFINSNLEFTQNKSGREGVDYIIKTTTGNLNEVYLQPINLNKERSVKILKQELGEPKENLWVACFGANSR